MSNKQCVLCKREGPEGGLLENVWGWLICRPEVRWSCINRQAERAERESANDRPS